jgi:L-aminopeptidase/D-esterase-like protein
VTVGAIVAVNAVGDVIDPETNQILAGVRPLEKGPLKIGEEGTFADSLTVFRSFPGRTLLSLAERANTVIGVVATNAAFNKTEATKLAQMAQNGVVRTIRPANTMYDGDTIFALTTGKKKANLTIVGSFAAQAVQLAILNAVLSAESLGGIPASKDLQAED